MRAKYGTAPSQFVDIGGGLTVHLRDEGPRDALPIILLHGSNADLHTWEPWARRSRAEYRVIRYDQIGHGLTGPDPKHDYSRDNYVADVLAVADKLGLEELHPRRKFDGRQARAGFCGGASGPRDGPCAGRCQRRADDQNQDRHGGQRRGNIGFKIAQTPGINWLVEQITRAV